MEVYVVRHTAVKVEKDLCYGQKEVPLADTFAEEARSLQSKLPNSFDAIYCSPVRRCKRLAQKFSRENIFYEKALMEMNFGKWEGKKWNDITQEELHKWMEDFVNIPTPKGENLLELYLRVSSFVDILRNKDYERVLLITHAGVIRCLWAYLLEIPLYNIFKIPVNYGEVFAFSLDKVAKKNDWIFMKN